MTHTMPDDLWRDFPKTATEFEARFATEEDCRAYWIAARWGGEPACARCQSKRVWTIRQGTTFECADCGHQTSLTSGTVLEKTRKPLKMWFRAIFEISTRRTGISAKDLQRIMEVAMQKLAFRTTLDYQVDVQAGHTINTEDNDFEFGDEFAFDVSLQYRLWPRELGVGVPGFLYGVLEANLLHQAKNEINGFNDPDSGGASFFLSPGLQYVTRRWVVETIVQIPVAQALNGAALEDDFNVRAGFRIAF